MNKDKMVAAGIDYAGALGRFVGNVDLYEKYLQKFLDDTHLPAAMAAYREGDFKSVLEQVHALKGLTGTLGLNPLYELCAEVVQKIRQEDVADLEERMQQIQREYKKMVEAICD